MTTNKKVICPQCKGNGFIIKHFYDMKPSYHDCPKCRNQGELLESDLNPYHPYNYLSWFDKLTYRIARWLGL